MAEQLKSVPSKRHRRRPAKSCEPCRARKIKCDRGLPCRPCLRSRAALLCTYKSNHTPVASSGPEAHTPPEFDLIHEGEIDSDTSERSQGGDVGSLIEPASMSHGDDAATPSLSQRIGFLEQLIQTPGHGHLQASSVKDLEARIARIEQRIGALSPGSGQLDKSELRIKLPRPHLRAEREKTRMFGKTHWVHSLEQFNILAQMQSKPYAVADEPQAEANGAMLEAASARRRVKTNGAKLLREPMPALCETIPAKSICDQAIDGYLRTFEPMFRILHVPSFTKEYDHYWTRAEPAPDGFLMKLVMVVTIGAVFLRDRPMANEIKRTARNWIYAVQWWLTGPTERDAMSIDGIQVFCLLLLARQASALGGTASIITEALSKLSFTLGLHIDPRLHVSVTPFESELRRRLWLTVFELTAITSLNSALPLLLQPGDYQVPLPSLIPDSKLGKANGTGAPEARSKHEGLDCSLQLLLAKSLRLRMQIIRELNDASREAVYERVIALSNSLQVHCRELSAFFASGETQQAPGGFHHKFLDTYFRRLILFLHRPFAHQARRDHRYLLSRKTCLESTLIMASHTDEPMDDLAISGADSRLSDFMYSCISGSGMFKGAMGQDVILSVSHEIVTQLDEEASLDGDNKRSNDDNNTLVAPRTDPLALLARSNRAPLTRYLARVREQWRRIIAAGRPSSKQYLFVSCIMAHVEAVEAGRDPKAAVMDTIRAVLREVIVLLRESPAYGGGAEVFAAEWLDDNTSPGDIDTMALFGFDFSALDPTFAMGMPVWADSSSTAEVQNFI
ncbi:hypothetical protein F5Y14DRAFT_464697 [Nemania sp. NC0429]|nr:hypothetical protein F5Y14DRAFT_464697 [Nemania sp. NC0429]